VNQPAPDAAWQIQTLADSAKLLADRGELREAEDIYRRILEVAPYHVRSLNFLAVQAMIRGELDKSRAYLEQALRAAPDRAILNQNMGLVQRERGELADALIWLDRAIALKPEHRNARLHKGAVLMELGRRDEAVSIYWQAWRNFPNPELVANDPFTPLAIRNLVREAAEHIRAKQVQLIADALAPLHERHGADALARVDEMAEIYVGRRTPVYQHALQRPAFLYLPHLKADPVPARSKFPQLRHLESATDAIREELRAVLASGEGLAPYVRIPAGQDPQQWADLAGSSQWSSLHFYKAGEAVKENLDRCPHTAAALAALSLPQIPGHAPEAFFSILNPGAHIPSHFGLANYKLAVHLPLMVPPDCSIRIGNDTHGWKEGECLVFDDSFQHEAWNRSDKSRVVLIMEMWHPEVSEAEREGIVAMVGAIEDFSRKYGGAA